MAPAAGGFSYSAAIGAICIARAARQSFSIVAGISIWVPSSASMMAFMIDGMAPMVPASPQPLTPKRVGRAGGAERVEADGRRHVVGARHAIIHEAAGDQLAVVRIDDVFEQHLAQPLRDAAVDLAFDEHRIDQLAEVIDQRIAGDRDLAGGRIDATSAMWQPLGKVGAGLPVRICCGHRARRGGRRRVRQGCG
jgi:hypothetical protein